MSPEARLKPGRNVQSHKIDVRIKGRCRIIPRLSVGQSFSAIQRAMGVARSTVGKWKGRFLELGFEGLTDAKRSGRPVIYGMEAEARVVSLACSKGEDGFTCWTQRRIVAKCGMSQTTVFKMLERQALKPHKTEYWCGISPDVDFDEKLQDVVGLYLSPPENAIVLLMSNKAIAEWGHAFAGDSVEVAGLGRLIHHSTVIKIYGESYRMMDKEKTGVKLAEKSL